MTSPFTNLLPAPPYWLGYSLLPTDLELDHRTLLTRGVPADYLSAPRPTSSALRLAFSLRNHSGWSLTGSAQSGFRLHDPGGRMAARLIIPDPYGPVEPEWESSWLTAWEGEQGATGAVPEMVTTWQGWLLEWVSYYQVMLDRQGIRRALNRALEAAGAIPTELPGLVAVPAAREQDLLRVQQQFPEAKFGNWLITS